MRPYIHAPVYIAKFSLIFLLVWWLVGCSSGVEEGLEEGDNNSAEQVNENVLADQLNEIDIALAELINEQNLDEPIETDHLPNIEEPLPQLGMLLFYSKSLGGDYDSACVTCHHPALGGADGLVLPIGVGALEPDLLGPGREHVDQIPLVPRNSPTVFNVGLWDSGLFWDSRVESLGKEDNTNGALSGIRTPDSDYFVADPNAGANLTAAQARFPVTSVEEMKSDSFESGSDNDTVRAHLAARIGDYGVGEGELATNNWLPLFQQAFGVSTVAEQLITFDNIAHAMAEFERSMVFIDSPWRRYLEGEIGALTLDEKAGAVLFFTSVNEGGAGCAACHNGPLLSDGSHHVVAFPQVGPGKGDPNNDDFGRERETGSADDRYRFRTPGLLNIELTAPYGHAGAYASLEEVVRHYVNPNNAVTRFVNDGGICSTEQYASVPNCQALYSENSANTELALTKLMEERLNGVSRFQSPRLNRAEVDQLVSFLEALTDDCAADRACLSPWVADPSSLGPDGNQLNALDSRDQLL